MALHKKEEALCLELGNKDSLQRSYGNQAVILKAWGQLEDAMALHKKEEALCLEMGNKDGLQRSYGNQAGILMAWGRLEEAMALHKKLEALCLELGSKYGLQASYGNQALILRSGGGWKRPWRSTRSRRRCAWNWACGVISATVTGNGGRWRARKAIASPNVRSSRQRSISSPP
jgi:tetratricopeptide (TPR) repeat protein